LRGGARYIGSRERSDMDLDLSRIEAWTRGMLEAEARRRRIRSPEFRTRSELIRLILKHQYGDRVSAGRERIAKGVRAYEQARGLLKGVVSSALSAVPEPLDSLLGLRARTRHEPPRPPQPRDDHPPKGAHRDWAPQPPEHDAPPAVPGEPPLDQAAPRMASGPAPRTRTFVEEPIRTHSMARLLASQGHRERALAIYEELLAQNSADEALRGEAEGVRNGLPIDPPLLPDRPLVLERVTLPDSGDSLRCEGEPREGLQLRWHISDDGQRRARAVLGSEGELAARLVVIRPDPEQVVRSEVTEHGPVAADGAWVSPPLPDAARCFAAVGLRDGDRFVAIVHAHPVRAHAAPVATAAR
jgi:hypothetical protein